MSIEAYLDIEETQERGEDVELAELSPEAYKGLVQQISIDKAEQSIIEEVVGVDGDDDEDEQEELREEREMKGLFEQLYEIDPETKEVFVKGSAYDLKKWDEDMVCFTFGDPERVIALESAISPGERYLSKCFNKLTAKHTALSEVVRKHSDHLRAKTISKAFAKDFQQVMGYPLPNIHMESFTTTPSSTNYSIAMEEMTNQQMALAAGAGLAGVAVVYKLVQWFAKALNKNTLATNSISENFKAYSERKETLRNLPKDMEKLKANIDGALDEFKQAMANNPAVNINDAVSKLKKAASDNGDLSFDQATLVYLEGELVGKITPFIERLLSGNIKPQWWETLNKTIVEAKKAQDNVLARLDDADKEFASDKASQNGQVKNNYQWVTDTLFKLELDQFTKHQNTEGSSQHPSVEDWSAVASWFNAQTSDIFTAFTDKRQLAAGPGVLQSLSSINVEIFKNLDSGHVEKMTEVANRIKKQAEDAAKRGREASKENKIEKGDRAKALMDISKEFQFVSAILRFAIQVRNQLGLVSVKLTSASEKGESFFKRLFK